MTINLDTLINISETVYAQEIDGEAILLDTQSGLYFGLNPVGTRMWQLLRQHGTLHSVYDAILAEYNVDPERLEADLLALVNRLIEKGLASIRTAGE